MPIDEVFELTKIDRWFLRNVQQIVEEANRLRSSTCILPVGQAGVSPAERENASSGRDPQFHPMDRHGEIQKHQPAGPTGKMPVPQLLRAKKLGFSDRQLAVANGASEETIRSERKTQNVVPTYR